MITIQSSGTRSLVTAILIISAALFSGGCKGRAPADQADKRLIRKVPVEVAAVQRENLTVTKTYSGSLEGEEQANIVARIPERITAIRIHVGDRVTRDQVCITLDKSGSSSQYFQAEANYSNAEKTLQRMKSLFGEGAISQQALDGSQTAFDIAKANFESARDAVELTSPISGIVTAINVTVGDLANAGAVLATVAKTDRMKVIFNLNETDVANVAIGQKVQVIADSRPDAVAEGTISQFFKSADTRSRSFEVRAMFPNTKDRWFRPGMYVKVIFERAPREDVLTIPNGAIQSSGDSRFVYVVRGGRAFAAKVTLGITGEEKTEVLSGLGERDTIVVVGASDLQDSTLVTVADSSK